MIFGPHAKGCIIMMGMADIVAQVSGKNLLDFQHVINYN